MKILDLVFLFYLKKQSIWIEIDVLCQALRLHLWFMSLEPCASPPGWHVPYGAEGKEELHYAKTLAFSPMQHFSLSPGPTKMYYLVWTKLFLEEMHGWMISDFAKTEKQQEKQCSQPFFCTWNNLSLSLWMKNSERPNWITEELDLNCSVL